MKNLFCKIVNGKSAKINLLLILAVIFSIGIGCKGNFSTGNNNSETTDRIENNRKTDNNSAENSVENVEKIDNSNIETSNIDSDYESVENPDASTLEIPSNEQLITMADESMRNFEKAASSGDFSDFYDTLSNAWKKETSANDLEKGFKMFIDNSSDVAKIRPLKPEITGTPNIKKEMGFDMLNVEGKYDTSPRNVKFIVKYIPEGKDWKLAFIKVDTKN